MYIDVILEVNGLFIIGIVIYMRLNVEILMLSLVQVCKFQVVVIFYILGLGFFFLFINEFNLSVNIYDKF